MMAIDDGAPLGADDILSIRIVAGRGAPVAAEIVHKLLEHIDYLEGDTLGCSTCPHKEAVVSLVQLNTKLRREIDRLLEDDR